MAQFWRGSIHIFTVGHSASDVACIGLSRPLCNSCAMSHRAQFSAQSYSSCTLLILLRWLSNMVSVLITTRMILRYMAQPDHRPSHDFQQHLSACIDDVHSWMSSNRLQLNIWQSTCVYYDGAALVCHCSPSAPTATICIQDWAA